MIDTATKQRHEEIYKIVNELLKEMREQENIDELILGKHFKPTRKKSFQEVLEQCVRSAQNSQRKSKTIKFEDKKVNPIIKTALYEYDVARLAGMTEGEIQNRFQEFQKCFSDVGNKKLIGSDALKKWCCSIVDFARLLNKFDGANNSTSS